HFLRRLHADTRANRAVPWGAALPPPAHGGPPLPGASSRRNGDELRPADQPSRAPPPARPANRRRPLPPAALRRDPRPALAAPCTLRCASSASELRPPPGGDARFPSRATVSAR